jgi:hypothetical protein
MAHEIVKRDVDGTSRGARYAGNDASAGKRPSVGRQLERLVKGDDRRDRIP